VARQIGETIMALFDSKLEQSFEYAAEPAIVARACQDAIKLIGLNVKNISRETGIITARTPLFGFGGDKFITLKISKSEKGTTVSCSISAASGIFSASAAQKLLAKFSEALSQNKTLANASTSGW
jgi:hypothetical protein